MLLLDFLLVIEYSHDLSVVIPILLRSFPIVQVDQHVSEVLVQSAFDIVSILLGLASLLLVGLLGLSRVLRSLRA